MFETVLDFLTKPASFWPYHSLLQASCLPLFLNWRQSKKEAMHGWELVASHKGAFHVSIKHVKPKEGGEKRKQRRGGKKRKDVKVAHEP